MTWKSYALASGVTLIATYFASGPVAQPEKARPASRAPARANAENDIEEQAVRLQSRLRAQTSYAEPSRNPFRFNARRTSSTGAGNGVAATEPSVVASPLTLPPAPPAIKLSGVAADVVDGSTQLTAILSTPQGVLLVKEGDAAGPLYRVAKIEDSAVELVSVVDGSTRRLSFKP
jgi:Tfp pilus assembly protein PilP